MRNPMLTALLGLFVCACQPPTDLTDPTEAAGVPSFGVTDAGAPDAYLLSGFGHIGSGNTIRTLSISAAVAPDGSASGMFELNARSAGVRLHAEVNCVTIFGSTAWVGGTIVNEGPFQGQDAIFRLADLGAGTKGEFEDRLSLLQPVAPGESQNFCDAAPPFPPLAFGAQGNFTISSPTLASFTSVTTFELQNFPVFIPCALDGLGELVLLDGTLLSLFHFTEDQAGGFRVKTEANPQDVSGYGQTSGDTYQGTGSTGSTTGFTISGVPFTDSYVNNFRIIGQGTGNNYTVHETGTFTVNANGEVTVSNFDLRASCQ